MQINAVGDPHGDMEGLRKIAAGYFGIKLAVGDVGLMCEADANILPAGISFFRGNHDNPSVCAGHPANIGDYGFWHDCFIVAGAHSLDYKTRVPGLDWWPEEQLSASDMAKCLELYKELKPEIVITHEAPGFLHPLLHMAAITTAPSRAKHGDPRDSPTSVLLDQMYHFRKPKLWVCGHWHFSLRFHCHMTTQFICLDRLEVYTFDTDNYKNENRANTEQSHAESHSTAI